MPRWMVMATTKLYDLARMSTTTTGTGTITLGSAVSGFLSFAAAGVSNGDIVGYAISDGANSEVGYGTYTTSGTTLTRTVIKSTNSDSTISLSGSAEVFITPTRLHFPSVDSSGNFGFGTTSPASKVHVVGDLTLDGTADIFTDGDRVSITNAATATAAPLGLLDVENTGSSASAIHTRSYWIGTTASPYVNNDCIISDIFNDTQSDSANRSWAGSFSNAYHKIPAGVTDSGTRNGLIGWATSVANGSYVHEGTLATQYGVQGVAGFQGSGSGSSAVITTAFGVYGQVLHDSTGSTVSNAHAGHFDSVASPGTCTTNIGVYSRATNGNNNYSFYGAGGEFYNENAATFNSGVIINESGGNFDVRMEGDAEPNLFFLDASTDSICIGTQTASGVLTLSCAMSSQNGFSFIDESNQSAAAYCAFRNAAGTAIGSINRSGSSDTVVYNTTSDRRIKTDITDAQVGLGELMRLRVRDFAFKNDATKTRMTGFIAQEVHEIFPSAVTTNGDDGEIDLVDPSMYWGMDYGRLVPLLVRAIQELNEKVASMTVNAPEGATH